MSRIAAMMILSLAFVAGCAPRDLTSEADQNEFNNFRINSAPPAVRTAFQNTYPNAAVKSVRRIELEGGFLVYEVVFFHDAAPGEVVYNGDGTLYMPVAPAGTGAAGAGAPKGPATAPAAQPAAK